MNVPIEEAVPIEIRPTPERCLGHSVRTKERCRKWPMKGRQHCRKHGGVSTTIGAASPNFKHGRYSKHLPVRLAARYEEALSNPRLLSLSDDIAVAETRLSDLLARVETGEAGARWAELQEAHGAFQRASASGNMAEMNRAFAQMGALIQAGHADFLAWGEMQALWETRAKLVQTEMKTLASMQQLVTTQQLMTYMGAITDAITRTVQKYADETSGRRILSAIAVEFTHLSSLEEGRR